MANGIIDPFGQPTYMAPSVPAPSTGEIIDPFDKPISLAPGVPAPSSGAIIDPFEKKTSPLSGLQELLLPRVRPVIAEPSKPSLMGELGKGIMQGLYQTQEMGGGLMALGAEALRSASSAMEPITAPVKEFGIETMTAAQKSMEPYQGAVPSYKNIGGVKDALQYLSHGVGTLLPMIAMSIASGGVGAAAGKMLAKNYVKTLAERMALEGIPGEIINASVKQGLLRGIERGALLGGYASSLAMEAGSITADKVKEGQDVEPLRVMMGAIPAAAFDVLPKFSLAKRVGLLKRFGLSKAEAELAEESVKKIPASFLGRVGKEAGTQFMQEAPTEAMQSVFERWAAHKDLTSQEAIDEFIDSFLIGGAGGALFGGIGGAMQRKPSPPSPEIPGMPPIIPPIVEPTAAPVITPVPTQARPEPGVTPPPVTPPPVPTPELAPPPAPSGPVIPLQPLPISTPVVEKLTVSPERRESYTPSIEGRREGTQRDLKVIGNFAGTDTFQKHGLGGFDVPTQERMMPVVISAIRDPEIRNIVIKNVPVDVVDNLIIPENPPKVFLHDKTVGIKGLSVNPDGSISIPIESANSLINVVAGMTTERILGPLDKRGRPIEGPSAIGAGGIHEKIIPEKKEIVKPYPGKVGVAPAEPIAAKEPWQMSSEEYKESKREQTGYYNLSADKQRMVDLNYSSGPSAWEREHQIAIDNALTEGKPVALENRPDWSMTASEAAKRSDDTLDQSFRDQHEKSVQQALSEGRPIPAEVLKDYPDLAPKAPAFPKQEALKRGKPSKALAKILGEEKQKEVAPIPEEKPVAAPAPSFPKQEALKKVAEPIPTAQQVREAYKPIGQRETPEELAGGKDIADLRISAETAIKELTENPALDWSDKGKRRSAISKYFEERLAKEEEAFRPPGVGKVSLDAEVARKATDQAEKIGSLKSGEEEFTKLIEEAKKKEIARWRGLEAIEHTEVKVEPAKVGKVETPKEQKRYLVDAIDEAIKDAPKVGVEGEYAVIEIPGDGVFKILNNKDALAEFKNKSKSFPGTVATTEPKKPFQPSFKSTGKRLSEFGGEYYNEFKPRKEGIIESPDRNFYNDGWYSNGYYAIKTEKPIIKGTWPEGKQPDIKASIPKKNLVPAEIVGENYQGTGEESKTVNIHFLSKTGDSVFANAKFVDSILTKYPDAKPFTQSKDAFSSPILFKSKGEPVAVVMPMRESSANMPRIAGEYERVHGKPMPIAKTEAIEEGEKLPTMREEGRLTAELTPDWKDNLFTEREYSAQKSVEFLAANSPVLENRTLFQAFLSNDKVLQKLQQLPIAIRDTTETVGKPGKAYYDSGEHRIFIAEDYANSSKERLSGTILEEVVHGLAHNSMTAQDKLELTAMMNRAISFLPEKERAAARKGVPSYEHAYLKMAGLTSQGRAVYYSLTSIDEFLAGAIRHPEVRDFLKSIPEMKGINKPITLWDRFTQWMSRVIFGDVENASLLRQVLEKAGELIERPTAYQLTEAGKAGRLFAMEDPNFKGLTSPSFPGNVAEDKNFDPYLGKHRLLLHVTDPDLKRWKEMGVLPHWLKKEYPEFAPFVQTQEHREERRSELKTEKFKQKEPFTFLKGEDLVNTEKAITEGDAEGKVWTDTQLTEKFKLSDEGIAAYKSVRTTLDDIFKTNLDRAEQAITENARRNIDSVFAKLTTKIEARKESEQKTIVLELLKTAHDLTLSDAETMHLETLLKETKAAIAVPLKTVKDKLVKIFNEVLTEKDKQKLLADYEGAYEKAQTTIGEVREIIYNTLGGDVEQKNLDEITKGLVLAYIRTERPANTLKELRAEFGKAKGYFMRDHGRGKYEVYVTMESSDENGQPYQRVIWNRFFDQIAGTKAYKELKQDPEFNKPGMEIGVRLHKQEPDSSFFRASLTNLQRLTDNAIEELKQKGTISPELADEVQFQILYELSDQFKARGAARHFIRRADYLIKGYKETELNQVLNDYISGWAGIITKQDAAGEFLEHMKGIPKDKPKLQNFASKYTENMLRNDENIDQVLGKMRSLVFTYFLGGLLRGGLLNSTQSLTMTIPHLAREVGWKSLKAERVVFGSAFDIATGRLSETEKRLLEELHRKGISEAQYINTIIREAGGRLGKTVGKIIELLAKPFGFFESKNREIAGLSWFRVKYPNLLKTMSETEAYDKAFAGATEFINNTQFLMTKANLPNWATGADVGSQFFRTAYTFRKFNHNFILSLRNSFRGPDGKIALDVIGRSLAYVALLGGLGGLPFLDDLLDEWEKFFGQPVRRDIKHNLGSLGGPALEKMGMMGIPSLIGIDMSGSLRIGLPFVGTPSENIFGIWAGLGKKFMNAKDSAEKGEVLRAIESASPAFIESVLKAYRMMEYGATTPSGKIMFDEKGQPIKLTGGEAAVQAFGFRPERIAEISKTHREFTNIESNFREKRDNIYDRFRLAKTSGERTDVIKDVQRYNMDAQKYRGAIPTINAESLRKSFISKPEKRYVAFGNQG